MPLKVDVVQVTENSIAIGTVVSSRKQRRMKSGPRYCTTAIGHTAIIVGSSSSSWSSSFFFGCDAK